MLCDVAIAWLLYVLLAPVNRNLALLSALFRIVYVSAYVPAVVANVMVLPLLHLAGARTDQLFLLLSVPNSIIWAAGLTYLAARYRSRREGTRAIR